MTTSAVPSPSSGTAPVTVAFPAAVTGPELDLAEQCAKADQVVVLASFDAAQGTAGLSEWGTRAVAIVSAGRSSTAALRSTPQLLAMAGLELRSVVLLGADPGDETVGVPNADVVPLDIPWLWGSR